MCENYSKDSFERFGDDLSQLIFTYLSLEDCFQFECVSKQWQRLVFNNQIVLDLTEDDIYLKSIHENTGLLDILNRFMMIVKKCENIKIIIIPGSFYDPIANSSNFLDLEFNIFNVFSKSCKQLVEIKVIHYLISDESSLRFRSSIKGIDCRIYEKRCNSVLKTCTGIKTGLTRLDIRDLSDLSVIFTDNEEKISALFEIFKWDEILVANLENISFTLARGDDNRYELLIENNKNSLKSIDFISHLYFDSEYPNMLTMNKISLKQTFEGIYKLSKLESLCIRFGFIGVIDPKFDNLFVDYIKQLSIKCPQLKSLSLQFTQVPDQLVVKLFNGLHHLKGLKEIKIRKASETFSDQINAFSFKHCKQLTHLTLYNCISIKFFDNIHKYLPQLQVLDICCDDFTDQTLTSLSQLKSIREIFVRAYESNTQFSETFVMTIIENCSHIKELHLYNPSYQTHLSENIIKQIKTNYQNGFGIVLDDMSVIDLVQEIIPDNNQEQIIDDLDFNFLYNPFSE